MASANSADPDQSDQGLHCLPLHQVFLRNKGIKNKIQAKNIWCNLFESLGHLLYLNKILAHTDLTKQYLISVYIVCHSSSSSDDDLVFSVPFNII